MTSACSQLHEHASQRSQSENECGCLRPNGTLTRGALRDSRTESATWTWKGSRLLRSLRDAPQCPGLSTSPKLAGEIWGKPDPKQRLLSTLIGGISTLLPTGPTTLRNGHLFRFGASGIAEKVSPLRNRRLIK